jgi:hypothetical protein
VTGRHSRAAPRSRLLARTPAGSTGPGRSRVRPPRPARQPAPAQAAPASFPARQIAAAEPVSERGVIFRPEALDSRTRGAEVPEVTLRLGASWLRWLYLISLGLIAAGVAVALTARTPQESSGSAVVSEPAGRFAAILPAAALPDLAHPNRRLTVVLAASPRPVRITISQLRLASPQLAAKAGLPSPAQLSVLLTGTLARGSSIPPAGRAHTTMTLLVGSKTVGSVLLGELEVMFGTSGGGS